MSEAMQVLFYRRIHITAEAELSATTTSTGNSAVTPDVAVTRAMAWHCRGTPPCLHRLRLGRHEGETDRHR